MHRFFLFTWSKRWDTAIFRNTSHLNGECGFFEQNGQELGVEFVMVWTVLNFEYFDGRFGSGLGESNERDFEGTND